MTRAQKDFMAMLREDADIEGWIVNDAGLRAASGCCPILSVAGASLDDPPYTGNCAWEGYAEDCGLTVEEAGEIVQAADRDYRQARKEGNVPRIRELESAMLGACGLS